MSQNSPMNARTVQQQLATLLEGTPAEKILAGLADGMRDKLLSALGGMTATERDEMGQRLMRMTPDSAQGVIANVVGSAHTDSTYTVRSGDSLSKIAKAQGVSLAALEEANPQIKNRDLIHPNQVLNLPRRQANA